MLYLLGGYFNLTVCRFYGGCNSYLADHCRRLQHAHVYMYLHMYAYSVECLLDLLLVCLGTQMTVAVILKRGILKVSTTPHTHVHAQSI